MKVQRFDRTALAAPTFLPNGWAHFHGYIGRTGCLEYMRADGKPWIEYRSPEEAFNVDALASFELVPFTNDHPAGGGLDADNTKLYQVGTVGRPTQDGDKARARILVTDAAAIEQIKAGKCEISMGYTCEIELAPGEINGQRYDAIQRNIRGNHVALVREGRAGSEIRLRVDGLGAVMVRSDSTKIGEMPEGASSMVKIKIDGVEAEVSEIAAQLFAKNEKTAAETVARYSADAKTAQAALDAAKAREDAANAKLAKLTADLAEMPAKIQAQAQTRAKLEAQARDVLGSELKFDGKSDVDVKRAVAEHVSGLKLDGKSEAYVDAAFEIALQSASAFAPRASPATAEIHSDAGEETVEQAQAKFAEAARNAHKMKRS